MSTDVVKPERNRNPRGAGAHLQQELVQAAAELLSEPGPPLAVPLRAVARAVGVSPSAVYRWFPSQAALLRAVIDERFRELTGSIQPREDTEAPAADRIEQACLSYAAWGVLHRGAYRLLFERPDTIETSTDAGLVLLERLTTLLAEVDPTDAASRARRLWGAVHGLTSLAVHKGHPWAASLEQDVAETVRLHTRLKGRQ